MNTWTDIILTLDLGILIIVSFYHCVPQRKMHKESKAIRSIVQKRLDIIYWCAIFLSILSVGGKDVRTVSGTILVCGASFLLWKTIGRKRKVLSLIILNDEVKGCFVCTIINLAILLLFTVNWKRNSVVLSPVISGPVVINIVILLMLCLRLIWNGMISIEKVPKKENGIKIIFVNSFSIICVVILVLSAAVYWLSVWDLFSYQINGAAGSMTLIDSVYYTVTTVTTVGYGDIIPISEYSRMLAVIVQAIGLLIISGFAVNVISFITARGKISEK